MRSVHALAQPLSIWYPIAYTGSNQSKHRFKLVPWPSPWLGPWGYLLYTFEIENNQTRSFVFQKSVRHHPKTITKRCQRGPKFNAKSFQKLQNITGITWENLASPISYKKIIQESIRNRKKPERGLLRPNEPGKGNYVEPNYIISIFLRSVFRPPRVRSARFGAVRSARYRAQRYAREGYR